MPASRRLFRNAALSALLVTTAVVAAGGTTAGAAPSHSAAPGVRSAGSPTFTSLRSSTIRIKNSHGVRLHLGVGAINDGGIMSVTVTLSNRAPFSVGETHMFSFDQMKGTTFTYSHKTGHGKVATGTQLKTFGSITLNFAKRSQSSKPCTVGGSGKMTTIKGTLSGKLHFNTKTKWGSVGSKTHTITFKTPNFITILSGGCPVGGQGGAAPCSNGLNWSAPFDPTTEASFFGMVTRTGSTTVSTVQASRTVPITSPHNASRQDVLIAKQPVPTVSPSGALTITSSGQAFTGSASIGNTTRTPNNYPCKLNGASMTEKTFTYQGTWSDSAYTAHFHATSKITPPATGDATFTTQKY